MYLSAQEAADALGVSITTLYAYVSRGLLRSEVADDSKRTKRYFAEDVRRLQARKEGRRDPEMAIEASLHFGLPILESAITLIEDGQLYYRGQNIADVIRTATVEDVALLIWTGEGARTESIFPVKRLRFSERFWQAHAAVRVLSHIDQLSILLPLIAAEDLTAYDSRPERLLETGARMLTAMILCVSSEVSYSGSLADRLAHGWGLQECDAQRLVALALMLCADHELNVSAFAARVVASGGATLYQVVSAGLAALQGYKHGGHTARVEALLREIQTPDRVRDVLAERLRRGEALPGFGHRLYPQGDPRAVLLLEQVAGLFPNHSAVQLSQKLIADVWELLGEYPTIDLALVTLTYTLGLPAGAALALFAIGRSIGWIGHAIEQYGDNRMIRPRARYVGMPPH